MSSVGSSSPSTTSSTCSNNAGVLGVPIGPLTADGIERQFATNQLGHIALTAQLFGVLKASEPSRVVAVSSGSHRYARVVPRDQIAATTAENYSPTGAYSQSKLYNILFANELARRLDAKSVKGVTIVSCGPGPARTSVFDAAASEHGWLGRMM